MVTSLRTGVALGVAGALALTGLSGAGPAFGAADASDLRLRRVSEFVDPLYVVAAPGRANRKLLFVVEQRGTVQVLKRGVPRRRPFLDLRKQVGEVRAVDERGLFSIAFDPKYADNGRFYAYFTDAEGDVRVSQFRRSKRSKTRAAARARRVIEIRHRDSEIHYGGTVVFGPDGYMYLATGDGGPGCDPRELAQDGGSLHGKLLRIDPRPRRGYDVPADNPFVGTETREEIYALGLRSPFRFSIDRRSKRIAIADVGQADREEINWLSLKSAAGANFGWDAFEGTLRLPPACRSLDDASPVPSRHDKPTFEYGHGGNNCAVIGGTVVRDRDLPTLFGRYLFADFCKGDLRTLSAAASGAIKERKVGLNVVNPTSFVSGRGGRLYVTSGVGALYRLRPARPAPWSQRPNEAGEIGRRSSRTSRESPASARMPGDRSTSPTSTAAPSIGSSRSG